MKKLITVLSVFFVFSHSVNAFERSDLSVTAGISANSAVYGASGKETNRAEDNTVKTIKNESGVFTESHMSGFLELNVGEFVSLGFEHTPDSISTPQNKRVTNTNANTTVSADFNDLNIAYLKLNVPGGVYLKAGYVETDVDVKESMASGSTYNNVSTEGTLVGVGYSKALGDRGIAIRLEGSYMSLDDVTSSNGVSATGGSIANGGRNQIDISSMEGLNGKIALTFTFGQ
jgi:hypothetical protein